MKQERIDAIARQCLEGWTRNEVNRIEVRPASPNGRQTIFIYSPGQWRRGCMSATVPVITAVVALVRQAGTIDIYEAQHMTRREALSAERQRARLTCAWSARCDCRNGHNSNSGRCRVTDVTDPTHKPGEIALCERCRTECTAQAIEERRNWEIERGGRS